MVSVLIITIFLQPDERGFGSPFSQKAAGCQRDADVPNSEIPAVPVRLPEAAFRGGAVKYPKAELTRDTVPAV